MSYENNEYFKKIEHGCRLDIICLALNIFAVCRLMGLDTVSITLIKLKAFRSEEELLDVYETLGSVQGDAAYSALELAFKAHKKQCMRCQKRNN